MADNSWAPKTVEAWAFVQQVLAGTGMTPRRMAAYVSDTDLSLAGGEFALMFSAAKPSPAELDGAQWVRIPEDSSSLVVREYIAEAAALGDADTTPDNLYMIGTFRLDADESLLLEFEPPDRRPASRLRGVPLAGQPGSAQGGGHGVRRRGDAMSSAGRFDPAVLIEQACEWAGSDDFGADFDEIDSWRDGLDRLVDGLDGEARLNALGVQIATLDIVRPLKNRVQIVEWRKTHPEIADEKISRPIFIVGQPRTGTTILFDLLAQDPQLRPPLTWEVDAPYPVPRPESYESDPRIAETQAGLEMSEQIVSLLMTFHPMGAQVGQEGVRITAGQFCSMIFSVQYRLPTYYKWLLYEADHRPSYRYHRVFLQHLQSGVGGQWLLKSPAHLWHLDTLVAEYPDALIVQTHSPNARCNPVRRSWSGCSAG